MQEERRKTGERYKGKGKENNWGEKEEEWRNTWERCNVRGQEKNWGEM